MPAYPIHTVCDAVEGTVVQSGAADAVVQQISIDSRRIIHPASTLFFALHTSRRDGHQFISNCYQKGVRMFVVQHPVDTASMPDCWFIQVPNSLQALQQLATFHRQQFNYPVIGITGSNGKTIVKEWLHQLLGDQFRIVRSPKSYNSQVGVPLSIWQMEAEHTLAIIEAGISEAGEMNNLQQMIQPTIGVFTCLGDAHQQGFTSVADKFNEKAGLFRTADTIVYSPEQTGGLVIQAPHASIVTWGQQDGSTLQVLHQQSSDSHTQLTVTYKGNTYNLSIPFVDAASIQNALCCLAVCLSLNVPAGSLLPKMSQLQPIRLRLEVKKGIHQCTLINDSYSADLSSLEMALSLLQQQKQHPVTTVILSDFPVAPAQEAATYKQIIHLLQQYQVNRVITVGSMLQQYMEHTSGQPLLVAGFASTDMLLQQLASLNLHNEAILIKGARQFELERLMPLLEEKIHQTVLEINLSAVARNLQSIRQLLQPGVKLMGMVKAFSYGSGSYEIASLLQYNGVDYLAVAFTDEGVELRKAGITMPIMVMNPEPVTFDALLEHSLEPELYSLSLLHQFGNYLQQSGFSTYPVHLKVDTGMHRLGFMMDELPALIAALQGLPQLSVQSVFSHLAAADDPQHDVFTQQQAGLFEEACRQIRAVTGHDFIMHLNNTSGILRHTAYQYNMVRLGIALYGITNQAPVLLEEALTFTTTIAQVKHLLPGETVGYSRRGQVTRPSVIATVRIGYADGYPRSLGNGAGTMMVHGKEVPVMGSVCMDMTMLDVTDAGPVQEGDEVVVFGKGRSINAVAAQANTIAYEIMTGIGQRVKRVYYHE